MSGRFMSSYFNCCRCNFPWHCYSIRAVINCFITFVRWRGCGVIYKIQLITSFRIFTNSDICAVWKSEWTSCLLTDVNTFCSFSWSIAFCKFIRIHISFDCRTIRLCSSKWSVFDVIRPQVSNISTRWTFGYTGHTVPSNAFVICTATVSFLWEQNHFRYTHFELSFFIFIPFKSRHNFSS